MMAQHSGCNRIMYPNIVDGCRKTCNACDMPPLKIMLQGGYKKKLPIPTTTTTTLEATTEIIQAESVECTDENPLCHQLKAHCKIDRIARRCLKTCQV
jgi:hypothetical protein